MFRDAALIAGKDLRIEARSRVATNQIGPFALLVLILFAFALDPDRGILTRATAGLFWITVLFCTLLAIQRAFSIESADGNRDALRLTTLDPAGIFLGKAAAVALELLGSPTCIPCHWGTFPVLTGTPDKLRELTDAEVLSVEPGQTIQLGSRVTA